MTCNDSGYQAIQFDPETHLPHVTDDCTGRIETISNFREISIILLIFFRLQLMFKCLPNHRLYLNGSEKDSACH